jgi:hypothetical protein
MIKNYQQFQNDKALSESVLNESLLEYTPEAQKEIEKILAPLIKKFNMDVRRIRPSVFGEPVPDIDLIVYSVIGGNWTHAQCFNQKGATEVSKLLQSVDVTLAGKGDSIRIEKDTMGRTLFYGDYVKLAKLNGININFDKLKEISINGINS